MVRSMVRVMMGRPGAVMKGFRSAALSALGARSILQVEAARAVPVTWVLARLLGRVSLLLRLIVVRVRMVRISTTGLWGITALARVAEVIVVVRALAAGPVSWLTSVRWSGGRASGLGAGQVSRPSTRTLLAVCTKAIVQMTAALAIPVTRFLAFHALHSLYRGVLVCFLGIICFAFVAGLHSWSGLSGVPGLGVHRNFGLNINFRFIFHCGGLIFRINDVVHHGFSSNFRHVLLNKNFSHLLLIQTGQCFRFFMGRSSETKLKRDSESRIFYKLLEQSLGN